MAIPIDDTRLPTARNFKARPKIWFTVYFNEITENGRRRYNKKCEHSLSINIDFASLRTKLAIKLPQFLTSQHVLFSQFWINLTANSTNTRVDVSSSAVHRTRLVSNAETIVFLYHARHNIKCKQRWHVGVGLIFRRKIQFYVTVSIQSATLANKIAKDREGAVSVLHTHAFQLVLGYNSNSKQVV